jgi:hydrogenase nickel incorporation protein HypB
VCELKKGVPMNSLLTQYDIRESGRQAAINRQQLQRANVFTVSLMGCPGCGKTTLIDATLSQITPRIRVGAITCDPTWAKDRDLTARHPKKVVRINSRNGGGNRLQPKQLRDALFQLPPLSIDLLLIENVDDLDEPIAPDVAQDVTISVFSVPAGDENPTKHPNLVRVADVVLLNKIDLLPFVPFELTVFRQNVKRLNPHVEILELSATTRQGMIQWTDWLRRRIDQKRRAAKTREERVR